MDRELDNAGFSSRNLPGHSTDSQLPEGGAPASGRGGGGGGRPVALRGNSNSGRAREDEELAGGGEPTRARIPGLYQQPNHSSPALGPPSHLLAVSSPSSSSSHASPPSTSRAPSPYAPRQEKAMDDINLRLESMGRGTLGNGREGRRYSPNEIGGPGATGQNGAMEIRDEQGGRGGSVYTDVHSSQDLEGERERERPRSEGSYLAYDDPNEDPESRRETYEAQQRDLQEREQDQRRDSQPVEYQPPPQVYREDPRMGRGQGYGDGQEGYADGQGYDGGMGYGDGGGGGGQYPASSAGQQYYPDAGQYYGQEQHGGDPRYHPHPPQQYPSSSSSHAMPPPNAYYPHHPYPQQQPHQLQSQQHHLPQQGYGYGGGQQMRDPQSQGQPPSFQPQPPHGGWGHEYSLAAAQNPYYAAAKGQLGFPDGGVGGYGSVSHPQSLRRAASNASSLGGGGGDGGGGMLGRSGSGGTSAGGNRSRSSGGAGGSMNGPPITKASVDEYRSRIKADPDPEAQFNFCKYLIEAAKKISSSASGDERSAKKYRDALLAESLKGIKRLATQGVGLGKPAYADAQFFLANCLGNGSLGLQVDHEKAYNLYVQASKQNHSSATYRTAVCNEVGAGTRRDHARAVLFYRKASALGDTAGMYKLGMILLNGLLGQQRNPKEAFAWLKRAASQADEDNPHALHELGLLYEKAPPPNAPGSLSSIVPYDPAQARDLFTQAGQLGYPPSQFKLGTCYEYGSLTCPVDPRRSIAWYTRAAERADAESELALSGWYLTGSDGVLKQSDSEAYLWARRAANKGLPKAEYAVGYYSEVGIGVKQDLEEAKRWYMRAAAQGNKRAMQRLTKLKKQAEKGRAAMTSGKKARPTRKDAESECVIS